MYTAPAGVEAVSVELCGTTNIDSNILYFGSCTDAGDAGSANDDCCDPADPNCGTFGNGSDPSASCFGGPVLDGSYESCTCHDNPLDGDTCYLLQTNGGNDPDASFMIEVNKKAACGQGHLGACCDTNGADVGCTDNVLSGDCSGADKVWTENGKCASTHCECIADCTGATCGDDGCGGSCGTCDDGQACNGVETCNAGRTCDAGTPVDCADAHACTADACVDPDGTCTHTPNNAACGDGNVCDGIETCDVATGCVEGTPLSCNNGQFCDGVETCDAVAGCRPGTAPNCDDGVDCTADSCDEENDVCVNDDADCSIPTVSEWGLVVLTLMLLIGAKVYFGRRQAIA
jgi:hypothetical protein